MRARAFAKVNLVLRVGSPRGDGLHPLWSLAQSIDWADTLELSEAEADSDEVVVEGADLPDDESNLAWRGVAAMRGEGRRTVRLVLHKSVPVAAGLGGGSADAAAGLALGAEAFGRSPEDAAAAAPGIGADVPFCLAGGLAVVEGVGERVERVRFVADYALAVVVPPFELVTASVYRRWDEMDGPSGPEVEFRHLPGSLRDHAPLVNDLQPAAVDLKPVLGDWLSDVGLAWGQPVLMTGSGSSVFGFFSDVEEATEAAAAIRGARAARGVVPVPVGWEIEGETRNPPAPWVRE